MANHPLPRIRFRPSPEYVARRLSYDPVTGVLRWKARPIERPSHNQANARLAGTIAGNADEAGYVRIVIDGRKYLAHHLAWCMAKGTWPADEIDHRNNNPSDNSLDNLRESTRAQNSWNRRHRRGAKTKMKGTCWMERRQKWRALIKKHGNQRFIGYFDTQEEASAAYEKTAREMFGEFARAK